QKKDKKKIDQEIDRLGAQIGVETRAETLIVRSAVLSKNLDPFLKLLSEMITQPSFPQEEIEKYRQEVVSKLLEELGNDRPLGYKRFESHLFLNHPYGKPALGTIKDVKKINRNQIVNHYFQLFRDQLLLVVGTGDADSGKIKDWARYLGKLLPGGEKASPLVAPENPKKRTLVIVDKPDRTQTQIYGGQIGIRMTEDDYFPLYVGNHAFGGRSFSARMMTQIRKERGWSYGAYSYFTAGSQPRSWVFTLFPASKYTPEA